MKRQRIHHTVLLICFLVLPAILAFSIRPSGKYNLDFFTTHNQFYLCDSAFTGTTGDTTFWNSDAQNARLGTTEDIIGVKTASYGHVRAELSVLNTADTEKDFGKYDHVVEGSVKLSSGIMEVLNFPDTKIILKAIVTPARYRVRIYSYAIKNVNPDEDEGTDHYKITLWPAEGRERKILKGYKPE
ncbi:hypothetical protein MTO98_02405 [Mucilaginibacter sp. SMC90]|uniref:hypothetical protein n=1 Tax=Mucilaginibacter sp. SMC90 TaxID=2929803 RepID=UPI001FB299FC|nr:hypothetical protein [Mucilaginibacter sp. SMC90]UOE49922.1 hypothetical protein MTO98_02405 [Mucilaginibacter sp. SMC90]